MDDNPSLTAADLEALPRVPQVKIMRRALGLTQDAFCERFGIPLGTLRDWEQGRTVPDATARAYLAVIAKAPDLIAQARAAQGPSRAAQGPSRASQGPV
jgi:putative transcriptional regulator